MYRSHNCGELNASNINTEVTLAGWVQKSRDKGFMNWVDLRDRYGITQLIFDESRTDRDDAPGDHDARDPDLCTNLLHRKVAGDFKQEVADEKQAARQAKHRFRQPQIFVHLQ